MKTSMQFNGDINSLCITMHYYDQLLRFKYMTFIDAVL